MLASTGRFLIAFLGLSSIASTAWAQGNTFNPYGNSGYADYREFGNPMYSNNPALPGQALLNSRPLVSRPRANNFQQYADELDGLESESPAVRRSASSNLPYYQAYQRMNLGYDRVYRPNNTKEDREFYQRQKKREQDYANAIKEIDPAKRAKLLRQIEIDTLDRPPSTNRTTATPTGPGSRPKTSANSGAARATAPTDRRSQSPPPLLNEPTRRAPSGRAPSPLMNRTSPTPAPPIGAQPGSPRNRPTPAPDPLSIPIPPPR